MEPRETKVDSGGTEDKSKEHENGLEYLSKISEHQKKKTIKTERHGGTEGQ